ncbi:chondroadherin-like protein [Rhipicephalus sanguineus]|nr:chondroadherin-like protein [Rhipicephalus sanguineus]
MNRSFGDRNRSRDTMYRGHAGARAALLLALSALAPSLCLADEAICKDTSGKYETSYTCEGFEDPGDFERRLDRSVVPRSSRGLSFILRDSRPRDFPVGWLEGINATLLEFQNVTLTSPESYDAVLSGLAGDAPPSSVERLVFSYDSTLPASWELLRKLPRLKTLGLVKMSGLRLGRDFGLLPRTVRGVSVLHSSIETVEDGWLAELPDLEYVVIRDSKLPHFSRSMLPIPALKLRSIDLDYNDLSAIPAGFGDGFPALAFLDLEGNKVTTIEERELAGVLNDTSTVVLLGNNWLHCDCKLAHLGRHSDRRLRARCHTPEKLRGRSVQSLTDVELNCPRR